MKISIALCTFNGENFLREQLASIGRQTLLPDELVACDDCSSDGTVAILREFQKKVSFPVHIQQNEENLGSTRNFEQAIRFCGGEIIALCDQDDVWREDKLEKIRAAFASRPEADYVFSNGDLVADDLTPLPSSLWEAAGFRGEIYSRYLAGDQLFGFFRRQFVTGAAMAFRDRLKEFVFPFPVSPFWIHDGWIALVGSAMGGGGIPLPEALLLYRQHQGQQIGAALARKPGSLFGEFLVLKENRADFIAKWLVFADIFPFLLARLQERAPETIPDGGRRIAELEAFHKFYQNRRRIFAAGLPRKAGLIMRELLTGRYRRFADSWKSATADLLL